MTRTIDEVRGYLRMQVNNALRRLGMYGDELSLILLFDALAYTDGIEHNWKAERDTVRQRGMFFSTGVRGAIASVLPDIGRSDPAIASVYAEFAHRAGWLDLDRTLTGAERDHLRTSLPSYCQQDRTMADVLDEFGPPSIVLGPTSSLHSKTLVYAANDQTIVCMHLWNGHLDGPDVLAQPILLAARLPRLSLAEAMLFTPKGLLLRPSEA